MRNAIALFLISLLMISCSNADDENNNPNYYNLRNGVEFKVSSSSGIDLLNPNNANAYLENKIKIFKLIDGNIVEIFNENADLQRDFKIVSPEDSGSEEYFIRIFLNSSILENAITYIEWNDTDTDTIRANFRSGDNYLLITKAWYNNAQIFDADNIPETLPVIIKD